MRIPNLERMRTMALLHRYLRKSLSAGRMPSLLGRDIFPSRISSRKARSLEDAIVFVCDIDRCLHELSPFDQRLIAFCILEDRTEWEAARRFRRHQSEVSRRLGDVLDLLYARFCRLGLLEPLGPGLAGGNSTEEALQ